MILFLILSCNKMLDVLHKGKVGILEMDINGIKGIAPDKKANINLIEEFGELSFEAIVNRLNRPGFKELVNEFWKNSWEKFLNECEVLTKKCSTPEYLNKFFTHFHLLTDKFLFGTSIETYKISFGYNDLATPQDISKKIKDIFLQVQLEENYCYSLFEIHKDFNPILSEMTYHFIATYCGNLGQVHSSMIEGLVGSDLAPLYLKVAASLLENSVETVGTIEDLFKLASECTSKVLNLDVSYSKIFSKKALICFETFNRIFSIEKLWHIYSLGLQDQTTIIKGEFLFLDQINLELNVGPFILEVSRLINSLNVVLKDEGGRPSGSSMKFSEISINKAFIIQEESKLKKLFEFILNVVDVRTIENYGDICFDYNLMKFACRFFPDLIFDYLDENSNSIIQIFDKRRFSKANNLMILFYHNDLKVLSRLNKLFDRIEPKKRAKIFESYEMEKSLIFYLAICIKNTFVDLIKDLKVDEKTDAKINEIINYLIDQNKDLLKSFMELWKQTGIEFYDRDLLIHLYQEIPMYAENTFLILNKIFKATEGEVQDPIESLIDKMRSEFAISSPNSLADETFSAKFEPLRGGSLSSESTVREIQQILKIVCSDLRTFNEYLKGDDFKKDLKNGFFSYFKDGLFAYNLLSNLILMGFSDKVRLCFELHRSIFVPQIIKHDKVGKTPLHIIASVAQLDCLKYLLGASEEKVKKALVMVTKSHKMSPLHYAARAFKEGKNKENAAKIVEIMVELGAELFCYNSSKIPKRPFDYILETPPKFKRESQRLIEVLLSIYREQKRKIPESVVYF